MKIKPCGSFIEIEIAGLIFSIFGGCFEGFRIRIGGVSIYETETFKSAIEYCLSIANMEA